MQKFNHLDFPPRLALARRREAGELDLAFEL